MPRGDSSIVEESALFICLRKAWRPAKDSDSRPLVHFAVLNHYLVKIIPIVILLILAIAPANLNTAFLHDTDTNIFTPASILKYGHQYARINSAIAHRLFATGRGLLEYSYQPRIKSFRWIEKTEGDWRLLRDEPCSSSDDFFSKVPGGRRRLSTTWPWNIKPSLAVIWGVCWMFFDANPGNRQNYFDARFLRFGTGEPTQTGPYASLGEQQMVGSTARDVAGGNITDLSGADNEGGRTILMPTGSESHVTPTLLVPAPHPTRHQNGLATGRRSHHAAIPHIHSAPGRQYNNYPDAPYLLSPANLSSSTSPSWAQNFSGLPFSEVSRDSQNIISDADAASPIPDSSQQLNRIENILPQQSGNFLAYPIASDTVSEQPTNAAAPQHDHFTNAFNQESPEVSQRQSFINAANNSRNLGRGQYHRAMLAQNQTMLSPVSNPPLTPGYKMASHASEGDRQRSMSVDGSSAAEASETGHAPRSYSYKRPEDPPRNPEGKMVCKHGECTSLTFDRKCEWSKHMDKHDRPYKCKARGCEKMQGFTYSGGLLRHEREVHKMHGGTKKPLFCPHEHCKRSSGAGFTRKENLAEHIRRVHRRTSSSSAASHSPSRKDDEGVEADEAAKESAVPHVTDPAEEREVSGRRKRRLSDAADENDDNRPDDADLRSEIKRLRREIERRDERLKNLEAAVAKLTKQP